MRREMHARSAVHEQIARFAAGNAGRARPVLDKAAKRTAARIAVGELHRTRKSHAGVDVLAFVKLIDVHVERDLNAHIVLDNLSAQSQFLST